MYLTSNKMSFSRRITEDHMVCTFYLAEMPLNGAKKPEMTEENPERLHLPILLYRKKP